MGDYPIACVGSDYARNSTPDQIAQAAKVSFESLKRMGQKMRERALFYRGAENIMLSQMGYQVEYFVDNFAALNLHMDLAEKETVSLHVEICITERKCQRTARFV